MCFLSCYFDGKNNDVDRTSTQFIMYFSEGKTYYEDFNGFTSQVIGIIKLKDV